VGAVGGAKSEVRSPKFEGKAKAEERSSRTARGASVSAPTSERHTGGLECGGPSPLFGRRGIEDRCTPARGRADRDVGRLRAGCRR
jgi:hypothetical protein